MGSRRGWKGEDGTIYDDYDKRIVGYGDPPSDPVWQRENPGGGRFPMLAVKVDNQDPDDPDSPLVEV
jgi:hypothetical protein